RGARPTTSLGASPSYPMRRSVPLLREDNDGFHGARLYCVPALPPASRAGEVGALGTMSDSSRAPRRVAWRTVLRAVGWLLAPAGVVVLLALAARPGGSPTLIGAAARATPTARSHRIVRTPPARPPHPTATPTPGPPPTPTPPPTLRLF